MSSSTGASIAPWLAVHGAGKAVEYYKAAFDRATFWVQTDSNASPARHRDGSVRMILSVDDPDALFEQAVRAGAAVVAPIHEDYGWRGRRVTDPFGHDWELSKQVTS